jgi:D-alanine--poly(phosphoribitol) ligase subunit 1
MSLFYSQVIQPFLTASISFSDRSAFCINKQFYSYRQFGERIAAITPPIAKSKSQCIGLLTNDHIDTYAAIWACWLNGKSYVPINPASPQDFNQRITNQLSLDLIIDSQTTEQLKSSPDDWQPGSFSSAQFDDARYIYTLFTSGSTGIPKGVPITGMNLGAFIDAFWALDFQLTEQDKGLQMYELTFDPSIMSYVVPLLRGACVYTVPKDSIKYAAIFELLTEEELTLAFMVPTTLNFLRPYFSEIDCPKLRYSLFCGEALQADIIREWSRCVPNARIDNAYGPTENTIVCTCYSYRRDTENIVHQGILSIGPSMKGNDCVVFNDEDEIAPKGETGELCLAGPQLTIGYLNNDELNRSHFFNYTDKKTGAIKRFYRTGDLCIQTADGNISYIGRKDTQVKLQGFRIELTEIEYQAKKGFPEIRNVIGVVLKSNDGNSRLQLVIEGESFDLTHVHAVLKETLPWYMQPKAISFMPVFPLNKHSKIDRKAIHLEVVNSLYAFRQAGTNDISFIVDAIINAEKSNSEIIGLGQLMSLGEIDLRSKLASALEEEVDGCEFHLEGFTIATYEESPVAALCTWVEGINENNQPSPTLKINLFKHIFGIEKMQQLEQHKALIQGMRLTRTPGAHQVEYVYVTPAHRGRDLVSRMIQYSLKRHEKTTDPLISEVEVFANNAGAIKAYEKCGYFLKTQASVALEELKGMMPYHIKLQLEKKIK